MDEHEWRFGHPEIEEEAQFISHSWVPGDRLELILLLLCSFLRRFSDTQISSRYARVHDQLRGFSGRPSSEAMLGAMVLILGVKDAHNKEETDDDR